jgi:SAM-dependent methyltransferase
MSRIHHAAASGYANAADSYVRGRPDYPIAIGGWLRNELDLHSGATVVDLGAGTGKFTLRLIQTGAAVIAVEPVAEMREKLSAAFPEVDVRAGTAESIPLPDNAADAVVCAQSFHWFATREALAEIHRVLKPGGKLGLVWNVRDERVGWVAQLGRIVNHFQGDAPRYTTGAWRAVFPFSGFGPLYEQHFPNGHTGTLEDVIFNRVRSTSFIGALAPDERKHVEDQLRQLVADDSELNGKDLVTVPYETAAFHTVKS